MHADASGDRASALAHFAEALDLRRELGDRVGVAETLVRMGTVEHEAGNDASAGDHFAEALAVGREVGDCSVLLLATIHAARLPGGDVAASRATLAEFEKRSFHWVRLDAHFRLWELTGDRAHLGEAKRLLDFAVEHAPEEHRASMLEHVPLHREIARAWDEHGA